MSPPSARLSSIMEEESNSGGGGVASAEADSNPLREALEAIRTLAEDGDFSDESGGGVGGAVGVDAVRGAVGSAAADQLKRRGMLLEEEDGGEGGGDGPPPMHEGRFRAVPIVMRGEEEEEEEEEEDRQESPSRRIGRGISLKDRLFSRSFFGDRKEEDERANAVRDTLEEEMEVQREEEQEEEEEEEEVEDDREEDKENRDDTNRESAAVLTTMRKDEPAVAVAGVEEPCVQRIYPMLGGNASSSNNSSNRRSAERPR